jgi:lipopolysaccharide biosynthesis glycosyltransferase
MEVQASFGFVTGCHAGDKFMVGATLASMRHYCPDVPICLIVDGDVDVSDLEREYDLIVLRIADLPSQEMREMIGGSYRVKLAAMWEGPFEHYVWMDSDAILWGDIISQVRTDLDFQIFWPEISIAADADEVPPWLPHFYFELDRLRKFDPNFEWRGHPYFSAGVYACRRNVISYEEWLETEQWAKQEPSLFQFGDQGILNYLVHSKSQRGKIKTACSDLQWSRSFERDSIVKDCKQAGWHFPEQVDKPMILHFCGSKPFTLNFKAYSRPFTIARLAHHRRRHLLLGAAWVHIFLEDVCVLLGKLKARCETSPA